MLKCVENCGPRHPPKRVPWARWQKFFNFTLYINVFLRNQTKNLQQSRRVILRCYYICFMILYCLLAQKKWKLKNDPRVPTLPYIVLYFGFCDLALCRCLGYNNFSGNFVVDSSNARGSSLKNWCQCLPGFINISISCFIYIFIYLLA